MLPNEYLNYVGELEKVYADWFYIFQVKRYTKRMRK